MPTEAIDAMSLTLMALVNLVNKVSTMGQPTRPATESVNVPCNYVDYEGGDH